MPRARKLKSRTEVVGDSKDAIHEVIEHIRAQVDLSMDDPQTRTLAASLVSGSYEWVEKPPTHHLVPTVRYHDRYYRVARGHPLPPCQARDRRCEVVRIWNFIVLNVRYTFDQDDADGYQDLRTTLETGAGDCDDATIAFCSLLRSIGIRCAARVVSLRGESWDHIYPLALLPAAGWIPLDMTEPGKLPGWEFKPVAEVIDFDMSARR